MTPDHASLNKKMPDAFLTSHRAREYGCDKLSYFFLDTHVAQLIRIDIRDEQVRAGKGDEQEQTYYDCDNEHRILLSLI